MEDIWKIRPHHVIYRRLYGDGNYFMGALSTLFLSLFIYCCNITKLFNWPTIFLDKCIFDKEKHKQISTNFNKTICLNSFKSNIRIHFNKTVLCLIPNKYTFFSMINNYCIMYIINYTQHFITFIHLNYIKKYDQA